MPRHSRSRSIQRKPPIRLTRRSPTPIARNRRSKSRTSRTSRISTPAVERAPQNSQSGKKPLPLGIIRSIERADKYWVNQDGVEYEIQTAFYCTLCNAQLHSGSIEVHTGSKKHRGRVETPEDEWGDVSSVQSASISAPPVPMLAASQFQVAGYIQPGQQPTSNAFQMPQMHVAPVQAAAPPVFVAATPDHQFQGFSPRMDTVQGNPHRPEPQHQQFPPPLPVLNSMNLQQIRAVVQDCIQLYMEGPGRELIQSIVQSQIVSGRNTVTPPPPPRRY